MLKQSIEGDPRCTDCSALWQPFCLPTTGDWQFIKPVSKEACNNWKLFLSTKETGNRMSEVLFYLLKVVLALPNLGGDHLIV